MFDDVFDDKQWKKARDATGLKSALTEKVSMGDEFKRFKQSVTVAAAKALLQKVALYEKQLKDKHAKDKYYAKLLKLVQDQKAVIESGIQAVENPPQETTAKTSGKVQEKDRENLNEEIAARDRAREYERTNKDPNAPIYGEARRVYLKLTNEFKTVEGKIKTERAAAGELLQKCKALGTNAGLQTNPGGAIAVARKIFETLEKIMTKAGDLHSDFMIEGQVVRKEEGAQAKATKALDALVERLTEEMGEIAKTSRACRLALKSMLQPLDKNPQAEEILRRLHV